MENILQIIKDLNLDANKIYLLLTPIMSIIISDIKKIYNRKNYSIKIKDFKYQFFVVFLVEFSLFPLLILSYMQFVIILAENTTETNSINFFYFSMLVYTALIFFSFFYLFKVILDSKLFKMKIICNKYILNKEHIDDILNLSKREKCIYVYIYYLYSILFLLAFWLTSFNIINIKIIILVIKIVLCLWMGTWIAIAIQINLYKHKFYVVPRIIIQMDFVKSNNCYFNYIVNKEYDIKYESNFINILNEHFKLVCSFPIKQENFIGIQRRYEIVSVKVNAED